MSTVAIRVHDLSKRYRIGHRERYRTLRDSVTDGLCAPFRKLGTLIRSDTRSAQKFPCDDTIWALRDVSFDVAQGEVLGIIGRNGAGKTTLLKVLARITEPSRGEVEIHGRVGSLLEVGTGFHPELTGRENIYLNGAILGMKHSEIRSRFDEIVSFAETEKFLDTPVKRYSTGMYLRLAFAVASHLEPDILLVDEVLAVGDAAFQQKCCGKMGEVAKQGRTVLFVSHQMNAIRSLCSRCLLLAQGQVVDSGTAARIITEYMHLDVSDAEWIHGAQPNLDNPYFAPTRFAVVDRQMNTILRPVRADDVYGVLVEGVSEIPDIALTVGFAVYASTGELLFWSLHTDGRADEWPEIQLGHNRLFCEMPKNFLNEGDYRFELILSLHYREWLSQPGVNAPTIRFAIRGGLSESPYWMAARPGVLAPILPFQRIT